MARGTYIDITAAEGGRFRAYLTLPAQGSGPGLVLAQEIFGINDFMCAQAERLAEEGYVCLVPDLFWRLQPGIALGYSDAEFAQALDLRARFNVAQGVVDIAAALAELAALPACRGKIGVIGWCLGGLLAALSAARLRIDCAVSFYGVGLDPYSDEIASCTSPLLLQVGDADAKVATAARTLLTAAIDGRDNINLVVYPGCGHAFTNPARPRYDKPASMLAYSRMLALLRQVLGPIYDLSRLWDAHTFHEFATRDVDATMATMVAEPYVNHVPTMTGGVGHDHLKRFYKYHFIDANPEDTRLIPVSRTVGADRVVDEMIFCCTHTREIPWMLPGVAPTGRYVEVPLVAIVNFRGDKLYHEHIYWDQASVLVQTGLLDPTGLPVAGCAAARKLLDESLPSNELMATAWARSAGQPL